MASSLLDVCRFNPTAGSTTDWTYSSAVTGYQSPTAAGAVNGAIYSYRAESNNLSQWEVGFGAYNSGTGVFARTTVLYNSSGGASKINFSTVPQVAIVALAEDLFLFNAAMSLTTAQKAQAKTNVRVSSPTVQRLTGGTAATYTTPTNCTWIRIRGCGGGGGGAGGGGSGVTNGGNGNNTTFSGGTLVGNGGTGAPAGGTSVIGGTASGGNINNITGNAGDTFGGIGAALSVGGMGASGPFGGGSGAGGGTVTVGTAGQANSGAGGGGGGASIATAGGSGGSAGGYFEHIITSPAATYTYTIGSGGTAGAAGTSGTAGAAGGSGAIIVEEYYD